MCAATHCERWRRGRGASRSSSSSSSSSLHAAKEERERAGECKRLRQMLREERETSSRRRFASAEGEVGARSSARYAARSRAVVTGEKERGARTTAAAQSSLLMFRAHALSLSHIFLRCCVLRWVVLNKHRCCGCCCGCSEARYRAPQSTLLREKKE